MTSGWLAQRKYAHTKTEAARDRAMKKKLFT